MNSNTCSWFPRRGDASVCLRCSFPPRLPGELSAKQVVNGKYAELNPGRPRLWGWGQVRHEPGKEYVMIWGALARHRQHGFRATANVHRRPPREFPVAIRGEDTPRCLRCPVFRRPRSAFTHPPGRAQLRRVNTFSKSKAPPYRSSEWLDRLREHGP
jgi:hypothetical protein